jgi:alpha-L-rhamnosidase
MFGDFAAWAYAYIAGVRPIEPGFKRFEVRPRPPSALNHVKATVPTPHGSISVEWRKTEGKVTLRVSVPKGTTAEVILPSGEKHVLPDGNHILEK